MPLVEEPEEPYAQEAWQKPRRSPRYAPQEESREAFVTRNELRDMLDQRERCLRAELRLDSLTSQPTAQPTATPIRPETITAGLVLLAAAVFVRLLL